MYMSIVTNKKYIIYKNHVEYEDMMYDIEYVLCNIQYEIYIYIYTHIYIYIEFAIQCNIV